MRRADRLFRIVQSLRRRRATTARELAQALEVSERTVYRDVRDLLLSGVPIRGEAGVGYALDRSFDLPPLMFNEEELEALVLGARIGEAALFAPDFHVKAAFRSSLEGLRRAVREQRKARFRYVDKAQAGTERTVQPLGLYYWGQTWTLAAWCELRQGFRSFRLDRIDGLQVTAESFEKTPGHTLADFIAQVTAEDETAKDKKRNDVSGSPH